MQLVDFPSSLVPGDIKARVGWLHDITDLEVSSQVLFPGVQISKHNPPLSVLKNISLYVFPQSMRLIISIHTAVNHVSKLRLMWQLAELVPRHTVSVFE